MKDTERQANLERLESESTRLDELLMNAAQKTKEVGEQLREHAKKIITDPHIRLDTATMKILQRC